MTGVMRGFLGAVAAAFGVVACSGKVLNDVGELNGVGGQTDANLAGAPAAGGSRNGVAKGGSSAKGGETATAGMPQLQAGAGGEGGDPNSGVLTCPTCEVIVADRDVRGIASDDQRLVWVEYGSLDHLGNHQGDGRLLTRDLDSGQISVLADSLPGPESVSISSGYIYVFVDQWIGSGKSKGVMRVPLAGGPVEPLRRLADPEYVNGFEVFASSPAYEFWSWGDTVYRVANGKGATVETFLEGQGVPLFADDARLYFFKPPILGSHDISIRSMPFSGGDTTEVGTNPAGFSLDQLRLQGDDWFASEGPSRPVDKAASYLVKMPKAGGPWQRISRLPADLVNFSQLSFVGDLYFTDDATPSERRIVRRSLTNSERVVLASEAIPALGNWTWNGWSASRVGLFFSDSNGLYVVPTAP